MDKVKERRGFLLGCYYGNSVIPPEDGLLLTMRTGSPLTNAVISTPWVLCLPWFRATWVPALRGMWGSSGKRLKRDGRNLPDQFWDTETGSSQALHPAWWHQHLDSGGEQRASPGGGSSAEERNQEAET